MEEKIKSLVLSVFWITLSCACFCQDGQGENTQVRQMLSRISFLQQNHDKDFPTGLIPSYRAYHRRKDLVKNDDNIFFMGLVVFTLRYLYPDLDKPSRNICDSIFTHAAPLYKRHQNRKGRSTYNYWQTDHPEIFPNGGLLNLFNKSQSLPDDMDVTSIILLAANAPDSTIIQVHHLMQNFTNNNFKKAKSTLRAYKHIPAYSTWFGKKMPVDFDFCVLTNVLYMINKYQLSYTGADSASLDFLSRVVKNRDYMNHASIISPSYNRTPVLLYHLSRLMEQKKFPELDEFRSQLIEDAKTFYNHSTNFFDKIILSTSLIRWGVEMPEDVVTIKGSFESFVEDNSFVFFIADITSMLPRPFNLLLGKTGIGKFYYYCPAYNYVLLIENLMVRRTIFFNRRAKE